MQNEPAETDIYNKTLNEKIEIIESIQATNLFNEDNLRILNSFSQDKDDEVRAKVAEVLVMVDTVEAEAILTKLSGDKDELVRVNACDSLCGSSSLEVLRLLKDKVLKDKSSLVRGYAALSIADIAIRINYNKNELNALFIYTLKKEKIKWVKINYYHAMYLLGNESYLDMIILELNNRSYRNRCAVVNTLGNILSGKNITRIQLALVERMKVEKTIAVKSSIEHVFEKVENIIGEV